jgi:hypothetical protein
LDILTSQVRERLKEIVQVGIVGEVLNHPFDRNPGSLHDRLAHHNGWILDDPILIGHGYFYHRVYPFQWSLKVYQDPDKQTSGPFREREMVQRRAQFD